jgi:hypothetical protein
VSDPLEERISREWGKATERDGSADASPAVQQPGQSVAITDVRLPFNTVFVLAIQIALAQAFIAVLVFFVLRLLDVV